MKYSLLSMATLSNVSKYGFSSSSTSSVLTLMASIAALSESENRKCTSKCTSFRQSFHCGCCYLPLGPLGSGRLAPILSICLCEVVMTSLVLSTACVLDYHENLDYASDLKSHTTPCLALYQYIFVQYCRFLSSTCFPSTLVWVIHTCMFAKQTPPSLTHHISFLPLNLCLSTACSDSGLH